MIDIFGETEAKVRLMSREQRRLEREVEELQEQRGDASDVLLKCSKNLMEHTRILEDVNIRLRLHRLLLIGSGITHTLVLVVAILT